MPTTTASDAMANAVESFKQLKPWEGAGMQDKFDEKTLRKLRDLHPGDRFRIDYVVGIEGGGGAVATLEVGLDDPHGLFAGYTVVDVLANLLTQMVEARLL